MEEAPETSPKLIEAEKEKQSLGSLEDIIKKIKERTSPSEEWLRRNFETGIHRDFDKLSSLTSDNHKLQELHQYAESVDKKLALLRKPVGLPMWQAEQLMTRLESIHHKEPITGEEIDELNTSFDGLILRLLGTNYFKELKDVCDIKKTFLSENGFEDGDYGAITLFKDPDSFFAQMIKGKGEKAKYIPRADVAMIFEKPPTSKEMWLMLATEGKLPESVGLLDHELVHDRQFGEGKRAAFMAAKIAQAGGYYAILQKYGLHTAVAFAIATEKLIREATSHLKTNAVLAEVHAYEAAASSPTFSDENIDEMREIVSRVTYNYGFKNPNILQALEAYRAVHTLRVMGLDDREIGKVVQGAKYDTDTKVFPKLEKRINKEKEKWGIKDKDTFRIVRNALMAKHELELHVQRHLAQKIAAEELKKAAGEITPEDRE